MLDSLRSPVLAGVMVTMTKITLLLSILLISSNAFSFESKTFIGVDDIRKIEGVERISSFLHEFSGKYASSIGILNNTYFITIQENMAFGKKVPSWRVFHAEKIPTLEENQWYVARVCKIGETLYPTIFSIIDTSISKEFVPALRAWKLDGENSSVEEINEKVICENEEYGLP